MLLLFYPEVRACDEVGARGRWELRIGARDGAGSTHVPRVHLLTSRHLALI